MMIKKVIKIVVIVLVVAFVIAQFVRPDRSNPPIDPSQTLEVSMQVPDNIEAILSRSCADCHTHRTYYPWYSNVAPASWFLANHVKEGRRELDFSVWATYSAKKKSKKLEEICEQVKQNEMPVPSYLWIHRDASLTDADRNLLCDWANAERAQIPQQ